MCVCDESIKLNLINLKVIFTVAIKCSYWIKRNVAIKYSYLKKRIISINIKKRTVVSTSREVD